MKNNVYPWKPQFYYIKVGYKGSKLYRRVFVMNSEIFLDKEALDKEGYQKNVFSYCPRLFEEKRGDLVFGFP